MNISEIGLSTKASVLKEARAIATYHLGGQIASAKECIFQGMFSRTVEVAMKDKKKYVVQLRAESVHEENAQRAHDILGDVVPVTCTRSRRSRGQPGPLRVCDALCSWLHMGDQRQAFGLASCEPC